MVLLRRFGNWLTTPTRRVREKGHPDLYPLDVEKLTKELNLTEEATRLGRAGLPSPDASAYTGPEAMVVQRIEKARQDYVDWAVLRINVLSEDIARKDITHEVNRALQADREFERVAGAHLSGRDDVLRRLADIANKSRTELDSFKDSNGLQRDARILTSSQTFLRYALIALLIIVEGMLNAEFFAHGMDRGLLGGFAMAGLMATVNVGIAFLFGKFCVPYVNHSKLVLKLGGLMTTVVALTVMVAVGLGIAHYRDALMTGAADPARAALEVIRTTPFELRDFFSWTLFGVSLVFGTASLFDGLFSGDLYPRYGSYSKRTLEAITDYEDELDDIRSELEQAKNDELELLDTTVQRTQASVADLESLIDAKQAAKARLSTALQDAEHSLGALLRKFRTENELHRNGLERPAYFDRQPELRALQLPDFSTASDMGTLASQKALVATLLNEVQVIRARIQGAFNQQFESLKPLNQQFVIEEVE